MNQTEQEPQDFLTTLARWQELQSAKRAIEAEERALREQLFAAAFPKPKPGINNHELPDGRIIKGKPTVNIRVDHTLVSELPEELRNTVFRIKYEPRTGELKKLEGAEKKAVARCLTKKPGLPTLEVKDAKP